MGYRRAGRPGGRPGALGYRPAGRVVAGVKGVVLLKWEVVAELLWPFGLGGSTRRYGAGDLNGYFCARCAWRF